MDLLCSADEGLFHVVRRLGASFQEDQTVLIGKCLALLEGDSPPVLQIVLVPNEHDHHIALAMLPGLLEPAREMLECVPSRDIIDQ